MIEKLTNIDKGIINSLKSDDIKIVKNTILEFRKSGSPKLITYILDLYMITDDNELKEMILILLNDMKNKNTVPFIIDSICDKKYSLIQRELVSSCWQSGLDYSDYYEIFTKLVIESDYACAIEAFSVIEQCIELYKIDDKIRELQSKLINSSISKADKDKARLLKELYKVYND